MIQKEKGTTAQKDLDGSHKFLRMGQMFYGAAALTTEGERDKITEWKHLFCLRCMIKKRDEDSEGQWVMLPPDPTSYPLTTHGWDIKSSPREMRGDCRGTRHAAAVAAGIMKGIHTSREGRWRQSCS